MIRSIAWWFSERRKRRERRIDAAVRSINSNIELPGGNVINLSDCEILMWKKKHHVSAQLETWDGIDIFFKSPTGEYIYVETYSDGPHVKPAFNPTVGEYALRCAAVEMGSGHRGADCPRLLRVEGPGIVMHQILIVIAAAFVLALASTILEWHPEWPYHAAGQDTRPHVSSAPLDVAVSGPAAEAVLMDAREVIESWLQTIRLTGWSADHAPDELLATLDAAGYVVVPREPTPEMIAAGAAADWVGECESKAGQSIVPLAPDNSDRRLLECAYEFEVEGCVDDNDLPEKPLMLTSPGIWAAMLAAAPRPEPR